MTGITAPCRADLRERLLSSFCPDPECSHAVAVHRQDSVCSVCEAIDHMTRSDDLHPSSGMAMFDDLHPSSNHPL